MRLYDETCVKLCEGQYLDIATSASDEPMSVELYFDMIGRKTAALISASIEAGALLATDDDEVIARYRRFGWSLGLAFQVNDDLLGIWGREEATGKEPTDLARHKKTLPVLYAMQHGEPGGPAPAVRPLPDPATRTRRTSPRSSTSSSAPAPASTPAARRAGIGTRPWPSSMPAASRPRRSRAAGRDHHLGDHRLARSGRPSARA